MSFSSQPDLALTCPVSSQRLYRFFGLFESNSDVPATQLSESVENISLSTKGFILTSRGDLTASTLLAKLAFHYSVNTTKETALSGPCRCFFFSHERDSSDLELIGPLSEYFGFDGSPSREVLQSVYMRPNLNSLFDLTATLAEMPTDESRRSPDLKTIVVIHSLSSFIHGQVHGALKVISLCQSVADAFLITETSSRLLPTFQFMNETILSLSLWSGEEEEEDDDSVPVRRFRLEVLSVAGQRDPHQRVARFVASKSESSSQGIVEGTRLVLESFTYRPLPQPRNITTRVVDQDGDVIMQ